jgi:hypothetical protein
LHEAALGVLRNVSRDSTHLQDLIGMGFVAITIKAVRAFPESQVLVKEACGFVGNLSRDPEIRGQLSDTGIIEEIFGALERCHNNGDRKVAKLALGALSNLATAESNRDVLAKIGVVPVLLEAARLFMGNENILEYAIGAISHLAVHDACNHQLFGAGTVEALLIFVGEHQDDLQVVSKSLIALRRLLKHSQAADGHRPNPAVASSITRAGLPDGARGVRLLVEALQAHVYDETVVKEVALLLAGLVGNPAVVPVVVEGAVPLCMKALDVHANDAPVADALASLLAQLPLEELPDFAREFGAAAGADREMAVGAA